MNPLKFCKQLLLTCFMFAVFAFCIPKNTHAQVTEDFEAAEVGVSSFTKNGKTFNLTNSAGTNAPLGFKVFEIIGSGFDFSNRYIHAENNGVTFGQIGTIKAATGTFKLNSLWIYLTGDAGQNPGATNGGTPGSVTFRGKLAGVPQFTAIQTTTGADTGFDVPGNGFIPINFATLGGENNTNAEIDELEIELSSNYSYFAVDNFTFTDVPVCIPPNIMGNPPNRSICSGNNTTFTASATGATAYQWQVSTDGGTNYTDLTNGAPYSNVTTTTLTVTSATSGMSGYRYRLRAENGVASCFTNTAAGSLTISAIALTPSQTNVACNGGNTGAASVTPNGGIGSYTYLWSNGATTSSISNLTAGVYTVTVTDNIICTATASFTITQPTILNGSTVVTNVACFGGNTGAINLTPSGGTPGYTFLWSDGPTTEDRTNLVAGTYSVTITDANTCTRTVNNITVTQPTAAVSGTTVVTNVACFGGNTGTIDLTPTGGTAPYTYAWGGGVTTQDRISLAAGTYSVTITDANACTGTVNVTVTQPAAAVSGTTVVTNVACFGGNTGTIDLTPTGGTAPYTYAWGGGVTSQDRISLAAGTYSVTITDANGCTGTINNITVTQPTILNGSTVVTNVACFGGNTGAINLTPSGGTPGYTFLWSDGPTTEDRTNLVAGTYSVTITDANSCIRTVNNITVTQPTAISGTTVVTNVACFGGNTGAINLTPTGGVSPYTFSWVSGPTTEDRTSLTAGTYSVTITDSNGCTGTVSGITVTQPAAAVSGTTVVTNVACFGGNTGVIDLTPTGGTAPYTYAWGGGVTSQDRISLAAGTYSVTITDANACTGTVNVTVTQPAAAVSATTVVTNVACFAGNTGSINLTPTGGVGPYTFSWASGPTTEDRTGLTAGTYTVTITDVNGCTGTVNATVTQPASVIGGTSSTTSVSCFGGSNGTATITPSGGTPGYTYLWSNGATTQTTSGLTSGTYSVTITDANSCTRTINNIVVGQPAAVLGGTANTTSVSCFGGGNGTATITPSGGTSGYTYLWSNGATTQTASGLISGTYSVTITDANSCTITINNIVVGQPAAALGGTPTTTSVSCFGGSNGTATVTPSGGTSGYTYLWSNGATTQTATGLMAGTYSVTITDANSCWRTINNIAVTQPSALTVTPLSQTNVSCFDGSNGAASISTPTGGAGGYTYDWSPGNPTGDGTTAISGLAVGTYTVTVTDLNGCTKSQSFTITQPTAALTATAGTKNNVSCFGGANGTATVSVSGGTPSYAYSWSPMGGTAATASGLSAGTYTVTVTDANGCTTTQSFTITEPTEVTFASASLTAGTVATPYSHTFVATGGSGTYSYAAIGVIPPGTSLSAGGVLSGTPTTAGTYAFSISATEQGICGQSVITPHTLTINSGVQTITFGTLANAVFGDGAITLAATSSAGLAVSYASSNQNVATISGNTLTIAGAGTTTITASQAGNGSYLPATAVTQTLTVLPKSITGTFSVASKEFDGTTTANIQTRSLSGVAVADQADVSLVGGVATFASANVGSAIAVSQTGMSLSGSKASNYNLQSVAPSTGTINPRQLTVTANSLSKSYGDVDPVLTYAANGLIGGDALNGSLSRSPGNGIGSYPITAGGLNAGGNYILSFVGADFTINKKVLTVTADNKSRAFNTANPVLTVSYTGFANGETSAVLSSPATASTNAVISSPAGNYPIIASGAAAENYSFNYVNGTLAVTSNTQTISFAALADKLSTDGIFTLNATSSAGLTVSFSSSDASIARIVNGNQVEILKAGTVNITASQAGNANFAAATPVLQSLKITDNPAPVIAITSSRGNSFNKGESTTLTATGAVSYVWSNGNGIISGQNTDKLTVRPSANSVYTVTGSNQFGRTSTQSISITVVENLAIVEVVEGTNLLSPDGDGVNDYFVVKNIDLYPNNTVTIYDATGKTLYKTKSYKNDWDGSINGNPLQTGSYFYIIEFGDGKTNAKKGYLTVIKQ